MKRPPTEIQGATGGSSARADAREFRSHTGRQAASATRRVAAIFLVLSASLLASGGLRAAERSTQPQDKPVREIFVPFEDLNVLLEQQPRRVLLLRRQYDELLKKAKKTPESDVPHSAVLLSADYSVSIRRQRARITGALVLDVLKDGLQAVPLKIGGVGLFDARLDGRAAPIGRDDGGQLTLFLEGLGRHKLALEMVAPLETTAARQVLSFRLPRPAVATLHLAVPGDVEVKSGAEVVDREVDEAAEVTRFELVPQAGDTALVMTLNSRLMRRQQAVVARSVLVDEVTGAYEKLHATVSMAILHRAVDRFRFMVPDGFEITEVNSPMLARWNVETENQRRVLSVQLREQTTDTVVLNLSAIKIPGQLEAWHFPKLQPLDVVGQVAVLGLLVQRRLDVQSIASEGLIPIDTTVLSQALPETIFHAAPGTPPLRSVVAYYAPQSSFDLGARFIKPPAQLAVTSNLLLILSEKGQQVLGGLAILPDVEKRFAFDLSVPAGWHVESVAAAGEKPLLFERYGPVNEAGRIHVRVPEGMSPGKQFQVNFQAVRTPPGWLHDWKTRQVEFPVFSVAGVSRSQGAVAVEIRDDMTVRPEKLEGLTPLDEDEKARYGLAGVATNLAYRCDDPNYAATLLAERTEPRMTARTFSFLQVKPDALAAHYELIYNIDEARARRLELSLPADTPAAVSISGLDGVKLKEYVGNAAGGIRRWKVLLEEARRGIVRLAVDFQQPLPVEAAKDLALPIVRADGVEYQSGIVAVEGCAELDVQIGTHPRRVDVGELVDADYQVGRRLLGVYGFVGDPPVVKIDVARHPGYGLYSSIVQRADLSTHLSAEGASLSQATFVLRTKALFLEVALPKKSELWSAALDADPIKPQREGKSLLVSLPPAAAGAARQLRIVYSAPVKPVGMWGKLNLKAPKLFLRTERGTPAIEVPLNDLVWRLHLPGGYEAVWTGGTMATDDVEKPLPAAVGVAAVLYVLAGGTPGPMFFVPGGCSAARDAAQRAGQASYDMREAPSTSAEYLGDDDYYAEGGEGEKAQAVATPEAPPLPPDADADMPAQPDAAAADEEGPVEDTLGMPPGRGEPPENGEDREDPTMVTEAEAGDQASTTLGVNGRIDSGVQLFLGTAESQFAWRLAGVQSLPIDLDKSAVETGDVLTFRSLGVGPELQVKLANRTRFAALGWGLALAVALAGLAITNRRSGVKVRFLVIVALIGVLAPLVHDCVETVRICNMLFYTAALLVPYYLMTGAVKWTWRLFRRLLAALRKRPAAAAASATALIIACLVPAAATAAEKNNDKAGPYVIQVVDPSPPVDVPEDAIILPYDPESQTGIEDADRLLVPYAKYVELWNRANPDKKIEAPKAPAEYALAGGSYRTMLQGEEYLLVEGELQIDVFADGYVAIPLGLGGGVLARAQVDGKPARLSPVAIQQQGENANNPAQQRDNSAPNQKNDRAVRRPGSVVMLYVSGKGRHKLDLAVRMRLAREGGWRVAEGVLPSAPATALMITVPRAETELRLGGVSDRRRYETEGLDEVIETALGAGGAASIRWRPKVAEGQVDRSLTAQSRAVLDVQEDGLRLVWKLALRFPRSRREEFTVHVPAEYLVEKVIGGNVRGWQLRRENGRQTIVVALLKAVEDREELTLHLWRGGAVGEGDLAQFDVPVVALPDAALHEGDVTIRRSPLLELRTVERSGVARTDLGDWAAELAGGADNAESPLGIRPYQAYHFATVPFKLTLSAAPLEPEVTATVQSVLKIGTYERNLESRIALHAQGAPIYRVEMFVPEDLLREQVSAPGEFDWAITRRQGRKLLSVYLAAGAQGDVSLLLAGTLGEPRRIDELPLPQLDVLGVARQQGEIAVQIDPAYSAQTAGLVNCESVLLQGLHGWLNPKQREISRLAIAYRRPDYSGLLKFSRRQPVVACKTISNVRITGRAIEETILLDFTVRQAGIRKVSFKLPQRMADARISVPMLRQKTIEKVGNGPQSPIRVRLQLQDDVMGELRVLVENDRLLTAEKQSAPIPIVETGRTDRRFVTLESAGRDEVMIVSRQGLEPLGRQQKDWQTLEALLGGGITQAYLSGPDAGKPQLVFQTKQREAVKTVGARIGLAQTNLVLDANGAYRAEVTYRLDNTTEQYLEIQLPADAELWTARVAGEPVKPTEKPGSANKRLVRIPLVKTAPGDLDYAVALYYGGKLPAPGGMRRVSFPLVHAENITVERSQVRLFAPRTHHWFDFGGTMKLAGEEADLAAGYVSYQTDQAERLVQTIRHGGKFAKVRAYNNLRQLGTGFAEQQWSDEFAPNAALQAEQEYNAGVMQEAQEELSRFDVAPESADYQDNRDRLNVFFEGQHTMRSRDAVKDVGGNWATVAVESRSGVAKGGSKVNYKFLDKNKLANPVGDERAGKGDSGRRPAKPSAKEPPEGKPSSGWGFFKGKKTAPAFKGQPKAPDIAQGRTKARLAESFSRQKADEEDRRRQGRDRDREVLERYQERLQQQGVQISQGEGQLAGRGLGQVSSGELQIDNGPIQIVDGTVNGAPQPQIVLQDGQTITIINGSGAMTGGVGGGAALPAAGLASLQLQLPQTDQFYRVYRFTTPLGDVKVTARSASRKLIDRLVQLAIVAVIIAIIAGIVRLVRQGRFGWLADRVGSTLLICLGALGILFGILPLLALVALIAGIVLKIRRLTARYRPPEKPVAVEVVAD